MKPLLLRALAAAALLALSALPSGAETPPPAAPADPPAASPVAEAQALIAAGRFEEALTVLEPLLQGDTVDPDALFQYGLAAVGVAELPGVPADTRETLLDGAIAVFHAMLVSRPGLLRVRLELARAFFLKGEDGLARREFEQVLAGQPPPTVAANVRRFLAQIRARKRWSVRVGVALAPDSNIGAQSDERIIYIAGLPFRRDEEELTSSGIGVVAWAGGEYQYPLSETSRLRAGADVSRREYKRGEFDRMTVAAYTGPRVFVGRNAEASLMASGRRHWSTNNDHQDLGFRGEIHRRIDRRSTASLRASWHERRYDERPSLDGPVADVSLSGSRVLSTTIRADAAVGWGRERPEFENYRHKRRWVQAGVTAALPLGFTVGASGTMRWTDYQGDWSFYTQSDRTRRDVNRSLRVSAFNRGFSVRGFTPQVSLVQERQTSSAQLYDYDKFYGELSFVRLF